MGRKLTSGQSFRSIVAVVMAVVLITSGCVGTALADTDGDEADPADEVFINDDGDAVLVYNETTDEDEATGEFGLDVGESVAYAFVSDSMEEDISGAFSMALDDGGVDSSGSLTTDRPAAIDDFSMDVTGEQTAETNEFDATLDMALDTTEAPMASVVQSASSSGEVVSSADEFATRGDFDVEHGMPMTGPETGLDLEITDSDDGYTIAVSQQQNVPAFETDEMRTKENAAASLQAEFDEVTQDIGGDATVTIDEHEFTENDDGSGHLDMAYTVELENVTDGLEQTIADELASDSEVDLDQSDAEQVASDLLAAELDTFTLSYTNGAGTIEGDWNVAFSGFESAVPALLDLANSVEGMDQETPDYEAMYEAQQEADLTQTAEWDVSYTSAAAEQATLTAKFTSETENWEAYTTALAERDIENPEFSLDASAETVDDEIEMEMSLDVSQEDFLETAMTGLLQDFENDPTVDESATEFVSAFDEADLELAKFDLEMDDGTITMEAGATFDDLAAFEDQLTDAYDGLSVTHIYGDTDEEATYVYASGMVSGDASEDDVRAESIVNDETTVHMPGEWDEDHPRLDMQQVTDYLGMESTKADTEEGDDDGMPGFGAVAALAALLSTMAVARYRN